MSPLVNSNKAAIRVMNYLEDEHQIFLTFEGKDAEKEFMDKLAGVIEEKEDEPAD